MKKIIKDISGNRYGRLFVLDYVSQDRNRHSVWKCKCDCGNIINVRKHALVSGNTTSCGCYNREIVSLPPTDAGINRILHNYKNGAFKREISFSLSREEFANLILSNCYYCGKPPSSYHKHQYHAGGFLYNGIDRINNDMGYDIGNVVSCCPDCNYAKRKMSLQHFIDWIARISSSEFFLNRAKE